MTADYPDGFDPKLPHMVYQGYTEDEAARLFTDRYNRPPEFIVDVTGRMWVGPVPERNDDVDQ